MGSGKSAVGQALAKRSGRPFVDLDTRIEQRAGTSVAQIFAAKGEAEFRKLEAETLEAVCAEGASIVALGGGAALSERAWRAIRRSGVAVRLEAPVSTLVERLKNGKEPLESRPLLAGSDPGAKLAELIAARERWYARADLRLETTHRSIEEAAGGVLALVESIEGPLLHRERR
jgi:shikimate kinase